MRLEGKVALITGGAHGVEDELMRNGVGLSILESSVIDTHDGLVFGENPFVSADQSPRL